jgi:predicted secreted protein
MARYSGFAATLKVEISAVYTAVAQVRDINGPNMAADPIEVSDRDSAWKQFLAGMRDGGEVTFDLVYDPDLASQSASVAGGLLTLFIAGTSNNFRVTFADATPATATFAGFVQSVQPKAPYNDAQTADVTIKVSGAITWA